MNSNSTASAQDLTKEAIDLLWKILQTTVSGMPVATIDLEDDYTGGGSITVVSLPMMGDMTLRLSTKPIKKQSLDGAYLTDLIIDRMAEAMARMDKFVERVRSVRARMEAAVARAGGGMRLVSLEMEPLPIDWRFDWHDIRLEAKVEILGPMLEPEIVRLRDYSGRGLAGDIRSLAQDQRRRVGRRDRLASNGAVLEIDTIAEAVIAAHGFAVGEIAWRMLTGERFINFGGEHSPDHGDSRIGVSAIEGRIEVSGHLSTANPPAFLFGTHLRIDELLSENRKSTLIGCSPKTVVNHPALASTRVTSLGEREGYMTDVKLRVRRRFIKADELQA